MAEGTPIVVPTDTVTFLLTDIEGSTALWEREPATTGEVVARHYTVIDAVVSAHGGVRPVEQGEGDSVVVAFKRASDAVAAALDIQQTLAATVPAVEVRIAVHTGEPQLRDGDNYMGHTVIRCARLRACAHGGQVLLSDVTAGLVADHLPTDATVRDLGVHRLRDLARPERVWQLVHPDLADGFAPLRTLDEHRHNLPVTRTSLVGRVAEMAELRRLALEQRLVTVTGAGGVGKTRLAQQVAAELVDRFRDGVWWVDLAPVVDADRVGDVVAAAAGLVEAPGRQLLDDLLAGLRASATLFVIDNCEHVVTSVSAVVQQLLDSCPGVHVLATSREPLGVHGETTWRVPSLGVPPLEPSAGAEQLNGFDAVQLFVERARQARPNFVVTDTNAAAVAQICQRLDGIALALELAAARVRTLPVERLAVELDQRFRVLTGGARTSLPRQRTLAASVDWSYDLLDDVEQAVLRRLGTFVGGFSLDAAETVCADEHLDTYGVLDVLTRLVDKSLVQLDDTTGRYGLLETVRQYVLDRATAAGELSEIRARHLCWCLDLAARWGLDRRVPRIAVCEEVDVEYANLLAALDWSLGDEGSVALLHPLAAVWAYRSRLTDSVVWSDRVLASLDEGSPSWVRAIATVADPRTHVDDMHFNIDVMDRALDAAEHHDDGWAQTRILANNPIYRLIVRPETDMFTQFDRAIELAVADGDEPGELIATAIAARSAAAVFQLRRAREYCTRLDGRDLDDWLHGHFIVLTDIRIAGMSGHYADVHRLVSEHIDRFPPVYRAAAAHWLGWAALLTQNPQWLHTARTLLPHERADGIYTAAATDLQAYDAAFRGDHAAAAALALGSQKRGTAGQPELTRSLGAVMVALWCDDLDTARAILDQTGVDGLDPNVAGRAVLAAADGDDARAEDLAHELLSFAAPEGMLAAVIITIETLAAITPAGAEDRSIRLAASAAQLRDEIGYRLELPVIRRRLDQRLIDARVALGDVFETAWSEGAALTWEEGVAYAQRMRGARRRPTHGWDSLTPTEQDIVALVTEGLTNPQIAERMFIETSTVKSHVHHIFTKLGISTRSELAGTASRRAS